VANSTALQHSIPHRSAHATVSFWQALYQTERDALVWMASWATFAVGEQLMGEGDAADHVIVILEGRTRICVDENGWERILAECGPGQLVGERGATVIAIEPVRGLLVTTEDFHAFIGAHPRVLGIVEDQLHDWLSRYRDHKGPAAIGFVPEPAGHGEGSTGGRARPRPLRGENCTIVFTDVVGFSSPSRTDEDRRIIREALFGMTHMMLRGISDVRSEDRGDGILTVVPPGIPTANVIRGLRGELLPALARHNGAHHDSAQFQLRAAVNVGPVTADNLGVSGEAIIIAARLLAAPVFKKAMDTTGANLGVIVSTFVYDGVIRHDRSMSGYSQVQVNVKTFHRLAWMKLFDEASPQSDPNPVAALPSILLVLSGEARHGWNLLSDGGQRAVTAVFGSAASSYLAAVRAAVLSAHRPVVSRPSRKTAAPQPASSSQAA
jgi:class 3 adenylate cyclase